MILCVNIDQDEIWEINSAAIQLFRVDSPQACDAYVCVNGGGPAWLASLSALHRCNNRGRNGLATVACSVSQCKMSKP